LAVCVARPSRAVSRGLFRPTEYRHRWLSASSTRSDSPGR
jgi:hypothetical protein